MKFIKLFMILFLFNSNTFCMNQNSVIFSDKIFQESKVSKLRYLVAGLGVTAAVANTMHQIKNEDYSWQRFALSVGALASSISCLSLQDLVSPFKKLNYERLDDQINKNINNHRSLYNIWMDEEAEKATSSYFTPCSINPLSPPKTDWKSCVKQVEEEFFHFNPLIHDIICNNNDEFENLEFHSLVDLKKIADREKTLRFVPVMKRYKASLPFYKRFYYWLTGFKPFISDPLQDKIDILQAKIYRASTISKNEPFFEADDKTYEELLHLRINDNPQIAVTRSDLMVNLFPYVQNKTVHDKLKSLNAIAENPKEIKKSVEKELEHRNDKINENEVVENEKPDIKIPSLFHNLAILYDHAHYNGLFQKDGTVYICDHEHVTTIEHLLGVAGNGKSKILNSQKYLKSRSKIL